VRLEEPTRRVGSFGRRRVCVRSLIPLVALAHHASSDPPRRVATPARAALTFLDGCTMATSTIGFTVRSSAIVRAVGLSRLESNNRLANDRAFYVASVQLQAQHRARCIARVSCRVRAVEFVRNFGDGTVADYPLVHS